MPVNLSSKQIYARVDPAVICINAEGPSVNRKGTGFFIGKNGIAVTTYTSIKDCSSGKARLNNGESYQISKVLGYDEEQDIAIIQIDIKNNHFLNLGNSNRVELGDEIYAIGFSSYSEESKSVLKHGAIWEKTFTDDGYSYFEATTDIADGNRGWAILNTSGNVVGITTGKSSVGISGYFNLSLPINRVKDLKRDINLSMEDFLKSVRGTYTVEFDGNGATSGSMPAQEILRNESIGLHENLFEKTGYIFVGWNYNNRLYKNKEILYNLANEGQQVTLKAVWDIINFNIFYNLNGGTEALENPSLYNIENEDIILNALEKRGYSFEGWFDNEFFEGNPCYIIQSGSVGNRTFFAKFKPITYHINYYLNGGANSKENLATYNIENGNIELKPASKEGYIFVGWFLDENAQTPITEIDCETIKDYNLYAQFLTDKTIDGFKVIETKYDLKTYLSKSATRNSDFVLTADIDFEGEAWKPNSYTGHFNGNGFKIKNIVMVGNSTFDNLYSGYTYGLFSKVENSVLENIILENVTINKTQGDQTLCIGGIAGIAIDSNIQNCQIKNITINAPCGGWVQYIGGLCGEIKGCQIEQCEVDGNITYTIEAKDVYACIGGLIGGNVGTNIISNSYASADITCRGEITEKRGTGCVGGLVGGNLKNQSVKSLTIENCYSKTNFCFEQNSFNKLTVGGLVSVANSFYEKVTLLKCIFDGTIINQDNSLLYNWLIFPNVECYEIKNCLSSSDCFYKNFTSETDVTVQNEKGVALSEIWAFVCENWDGEIWNLYVDKNPTLKAFNSLTEEV